MVSHVFPVSKVQTLRIENWGSQPTVTCTIYQLITRFSRPSSTIVRQREADTLYQAEMNLPLPLVPSTFTKPPNTTTSPNTTILIPHCAQDEETDYEVELAVVLSKTVKNVTEEEARECVLGYTVGNDLTARKVQEMTSQWGYSKGEPTPPHKL